MPPVNDKPSQDSLSRAAPAREESGRRAQVLRDSEDRFKRLVEILPDAVYIQSGGKIALLNRAGARLLGAETEEEVLGRDVSEFIHPDSRDLALDGMRRLFQDGKDIPLIRGKSLRLDGSAVDVEVLATPCRYRGEPAALIVARDLTGLRMAEDQIRLLVHAVQSSSELISITDLQDRFTFVNQAFLKAYGFTEEEVLSRTPEIVRSPNNPAHILPEILEQSRLGGWKGELLNRRKDGSEFPIYLSTSKITDDEGTALGLLGVATDISDRKQALEERKRLQEQLLQAQKMEAIGHLAGGVAHDFNNLLTIIIGHAARMEAKAQGTFRETAMRIREAGERAAAMTAQLLAFSRRQLIQPTVLDLNDAVTENTNMLRRLIGENIQLSTSLELGLRRIRADRGQIDQVIMNLAINARDAMPCGGRLTIETRNARLNEGDVPQCAGVQAREYVLLAVSDTGVGMNEETLPHIFEPFFTTKEKAKGTGLGLSTVYGIVKQCEGCILVESVPGKGSRFTVYLPPVADQEEVRLPEPALSEESGGGETVMVVEDEPEVRKLVCDVLQACGYTVLESEDAAAAIAVSERRDARIDLLITDVVMPDLGGRELADRVTARHPETKVLYMSGYTDDTILLGEALEYQARFLQKPFSPRALMLKTRETLGKH